VDEGALIVRADVKKLLMWWPLAAAGGVALAGTAQAAPITYTGPFVTADATFGPVVEDSSTDPQPLYGTPNSVFSSSEIFFTPTAEFSATSQGGSSTDPDDPSGAFANTRGLLTQVVITANSPLGLGTVTIRELGNYRLMSFGGSAGVFADAVATLTVTQGPGAGQPATSQELDLSTGAGDDFFASTSGPINTSGSFSGFTTFDLGGAMQVVLTLDNELVAFSESDSRGSISKSRVEISVTPVPEPASMGLVAAVGALLLRRRRRSS
jgi:hypothetical protein